MTEDSFSDGGSFLAPTAALRHAHRLLDDGADYVELGPAASHPGARRVPPAEQIRRLAPILARLVADGAHVSIDSCDPGVQRFAAAHGAAMINDVRGFPNPRIGAACAAAGCLLVVMHSIGRRHRTPDSAPRRPLPVLTAVDRFLRRRIAALVSHGVTRSRLIVDPGLGRFLGTTPEPAIAVLRCIGAIRDRTGLPVMISVSRKSFVQRLTGRSPRAPERDPSLPRSSPCPEAPSGSAPTTSEPCVTHSSCGRRSARRRPNPRWSRAKGRRPTSRTRARPRRSSERASRRWCSPLANTREASGSASPRACTCAP